MQLLGSHQRRRRRAIAVIIVLVLSAAVFVLVSNSYVLLLGATLTRRASEGAVPCKPLRKRVHRRGSVLVDGFRFVQGPRSRVGLVWAYGHVLQTRVGPNMI
jgi:hypothetical protein